MTTEMTIAETTEHRVVSAWKGPEPGSCGFECSCGDVFDGFDSIMEAEACHKALKVEPVQIAEAPKPAPKPDPRAEYIAGLRALANLLEAHPELMTPHSQIQVIPMGAEQCREQLAAWARALPGRKTKDIGERMANLVGSLRGVKVQVLAYRDEVCEKVVTGVETVTRKVKDPEALAAVPEVEVTEEVEQYKWICRPMLADEEPVAVTR